MAEAVILPKQGNTVEECILNSWKVAVGDEVRAGQVIAEIETDKATFEVESTAAGKVLALLHEAGSVVPVLANICIVGAAGEDISAFSTAEKAISGEPVPARENAPPAPDNKPETPSVVPAPLSGPGSAKGSSPRARNLAHEKGVEIGGVSGSGPGGRVIARDVEAAVADGAVLSPLARKLAAEDGLLAPSRGSGIGGRVLAADLFAAAPVAPAGEVEEVKISGVRKLIAERMRHSLESTAQLTLNTSANCSRMLALRKRFKATSDGRAAITLGDMIMYAVSRTLRAHPDLNSTFENGLWRKVRDVHLGFACNTKRGLMVPVVRGAHRLSLLAMAESIKDLAAQADGGQIAPDLLSGGTFTVTNLGVLGIESFTPVLNAPQTAILGVGSVELKPMRENGEIIFSDRINLSLTIDHQVVDGWQASLFLKELAAELAEFDLMLAD
ncbi:MAG: 2-oxo acid dehydrogenase subunit E2 [Planctomycetes bacterium]|nr:2-oxo acid dehydrogenase subunit E2 [Planctomycetota bacterium]